MGKRKLHNATYYQCDWTGFPMRCANCFMPSWSTEGKLIKKGSYCNWESVLAHARHLYNVEKTLEAHDLERVHDFVKTQMGDTIYSTDAPHFTDLEHFRGDDTKNMNAEQYHKACCYQTDEVFGVKINEAGNVFEVLMDPNDGKFDFSKFIMRPRPYTHTETPPSMFQSYRKGKQKEKELCVFYYTDRREGNVNTLASSLFKMQICGEVLMVQCTKEASFMPRERYVNYTVQEFHDNFMRKRKRTVAEVASLDPEEYGALKREMQQSLSAYEKQASSLAQTPQCLAKAQKMPPANGRDLARLVKHQMES